MVIRRAYKRVGRPGVVIVATAALCHAAMTAAQSPTTPAAATPEAVSAAPATGAPAQPLFDGDGIIELTLEAPIRTLVNRRGRRPEVDGTIAYTDQNGAEVVLDVEVTTRGHSRLTLCSFPPLSLNLKRGQVGGTLFASQNRLKLVTRCNDNERAEEYLALEFTAYRIFQQVSDYAFRVRPVRMRYVDSERDDRTEEAPGFLIEHINGLAARTGLEALDLPSVPLADIDRRQAAALGVFQYLIGNTDWSAVAAADGEDCCHNSGIIGHGEESGPYFPVPYDFDMSGLVNASYAEPNPDLPIDDVRDRLYRGYCMANDEIARTIAAFNAARTRIEELIATAAISDDRRADTLAFLAEGYEILNDPEQRQSKILDVCRGRTYAEDSSDE